MNTHHDGIWISEAKEKHIVETLSQNLEQAGFKSLPAEKDLNFGFATTWQRGHRQVLCRVVDSVFLPNPNACDNPHCVIITDNHALKPTKAQIFELIPDFWNIWKFDPVYLDRPSQYGFNCFMNRPRGDRNVVFYELLRRDLLDQGLVSYNCQSWQLDQQFQQADLARRYQAQHDHAMRLVPYNTVESHGSLEQCIIDSNISLVLETYTSDSHIVFSEKIFRCLQMPRPWLLYSSPGSLALLQQHGFDILDDVLDISYDQTNNHSQRLRQILDQLEIIAKRTWSSNETTRFYQAQQHNLQRLDELKITWPAKFDRALDFIGQL